MSPRKNIKANNTSLVVVLFVLVIFGLIMLASASAVVGFTNYQDNYHYLKHQFLFGFLPGLFLFFLFAKIPYKFWQKNAGWVFLLTIFLLLLVFVPGISVKNTHAKSWLNFKIFSLQPSEIAKLGLIIYLSAWFSKQKKLAHQLLPRPTSFLILVSLVAGLVACQPDIGTMSIILIIALGIYFVAGAKWSHLISLLLFGSGALILLIKLAPYRLKRIVAFLHPSLDTQGISYHINQALLAVGSGGWLGRGLGKSLQKFEYLPEVVGDSIFAIMAEELGLIFSVLFIVLLFYFVLKVFKVAANTKDNFAKLFSVGLALWVGGQSFLNIGAMLRILPLTGVPLPFVSYGGTSLMILMASSGILLNISKANH